MKYKNFIGSFAVLTIVFCFAAFSPNEAFGQVRKKQPVRKTASGKTVRKKQTPAAVRAPKIYTIRDEGEAPAVIASASQNPPKNVSLGVVNGKASNLIIPNYPAAAKAVRAAGAVNVTVVIDEQGSVISASAVSGHPLLRQSAEQAARESKFTPTILRGEAVRIQGIIVYNFVAQ